MRKASSGSLLSIYTSCCFQFLLTGSEDPDRTTRMRKLNLAFAALICPKTRGPNMGEKALRETALRENKD